MKIQIKKSVLKQVVKKILNQNSNIKNLKTKFPGAIQSLIKRVSQPIQQDNNNKVSVKEDNNKLYVYVNGNLEYTSQLQDIGGKLHDEGTDGYMSFNNIWNGKQWQQVDYSGQDMQQSKQESKCQHCGKKVKFPQGVNKGNCPHCGQVITNKKLDEVAPKGYQKIVKGIKKDPNVDNPWRVRWSMKNKGIKPKK